MSSARGEGYRPYLDGLRAIAVGGVIAYHLNRQLLPGGYLGVDLFFVLSGYLITTLLVTEHRRRGAIDLPAFWSRRLRRLMPAVLILVLVLSAVTFVRGDQLAASSVRGDLLATLFYFANWHFILTDQSYFAQFVAVSPVRHAWSLAIEEQFYLVWPLVASLVLSRFGSRGLAATATAVSIVSISALWLLFEGAADPSRAYFGTDARIYQLLIGALLAIALLSNQRVRLLSIARPLAPPALLAIAAAMLWLADDSALYYLGGGPALVVAVAILIAGLEAGSPLTRVLSLRLLVVIGLVSYGLYLWHWPIILFVGEWLGPTSDPLPAAAAVIATVVAASVSFLLVERPIRRGVIPWLQFSPRRLLVLVPATSGIVAISILLATGIGATPFWASAAARGEPAGQGGQPDASAGVTIGVVGDSVIVSAIPGLRTEVAARGWNLVEAAFAGCPVGYNPLFDLEGVASSFNEACESVRPAHDTLITRRPDVVIWHDLQSVLSRRSPSGDLLVAGSRPWSDGLLSEWETVLGRLIDGGSQVVIVLPALRSQDRAGCQGSVRSQRCAEVQSQDELIRAATRLFWARVHAWPGVHLIEIDELVCPDGLPCPASIDEVEVRHGAWDQTHFTDAGASWLAPRLLDGVLAEIGYAPATSRPATPAATPSLP